MAVKVGLTALVVIFAVGLVLYIVMGNDKKFSGRPRRCRSPPTS